LPQDATSGNVKAELVVADTKGTAYFDNVQLEEGIGANRYNIIENQSFKKGMDGWYKLGDAVTGIANNNGPAGRNTYYIWSDINAYGDARQDINLSGKKVKI